MRSISILILSAAVSPGCGPGELASDTIDASDAAASTQDDASGAPTTTSLPPTATADGEPTTDAQASTSGDATSGGEDSTTAEPAASVHPKWLRGFGDGDGQVGTTVASAPDGSVVVAGMVLGSFAMDGVMVANLAGGPDLVLAKLSPAGKVLWARVFASDLVVGPAPTELAVLDSGDILLGGTFAEALDLGDGPIVAKSESSRSDIFVARFDAGGELLWTRTFGGDQQALSRMTTDAQGNILLSGSFQGALSFGGAPLLGPAGEQDPFVAKLSGTGDLLWNRTFHLETVLGSLWGDSPMVGSDAQGNIYVAGDSFVGELDLGGMKLVSEGAIGDKYLVKYDPNGTAMWARNFPKQGADGFVSGDRLVVHDDGTAWLGGDINIDPSASIDFGGGAVAGNCGATVCTFLGAIDAEGQTMHALTLAGSDELSMASMTSDRAGGVVLAGYFSGTVTLGPQQLVSDYLLADKGKDKYIARVDASGVPLWAKTLVTSDGFGGIAGVSVDSAQRVAVTGVFWGDTLTLDPLSIPISVMSGKSDLFVAQLGPTD